MKLFVLIFIVFSLPGIVYAESEKELIQSHLKLVEEGLRSKDASHLSKPLQKARLRNLDNLKAYWQKGVFPRNTKHPNQRVPYFIDDGGRSCAMAHLLIESGSKEAALQIQLRENNARVHEIQSPEFGMWLSSSGLTLDETAWIQPGYSYVPTCNCQCDIALVNDGENLFVNECVATRCNQVNLRALDVGCGDVKSEHVWSQQFNTPWLSEYDVCIEQRSQLIESGKLRSEWIPDVLCKTPAAKITGNYPVEPDEDGGCSSNGSSSPVELWLLGVGLLFFRRKKHQGSTTG